jgi:hypothetical protein
VSQTCTQTDHQSPPGAAVPGAGIDGMNSPPRAATVQRPRSVRWSRQIIDDSHTVLEVACAAWPWWQDALARAGLYGRTGRPVITIEGEDDLFVVFTATVLPASARPVQPAAPIRAVPARALPRARTRRGAAA